MKNAFFTAILFLSVTSQASTFVGEIELDKAQTLSPADHHTLFLKRIRVVADTSAIERAELKLSDSNVSYHLGTDDVCNPRDTEVSITGHTTAAPIGLSFYEIDNERDVFHSSQQTDLSFSLQQSFEQSVEETIPTIFQNNSTMSMSASSITSGKLDVSARMATSLDTQDIAIEITGVQVGGVAEYRQNNISNQSVKSVIVSYRAYPRDQNPANPMELAVGQAVLKLVK